MWVRPSANLMALSGVTQVLFASAHTLRSFGTAEVTEATAPTGDFDQDGVSNLIERALGLDPTSVDDANGVGKLPQGKQVTTGQFANRPTLTFTMPEIPPSDLTYEVQQSADQKIWSPIARRVGLSDWQDLGNVVIEIEAPLQGKVTVQVGGPPIASEEAPVHLRLKVVVPTP